MSQICCDQGREAAWPLADLDSVHLPAHGYLIAFAMHFLLPRAAFVAPEMFSTVPSKVNGCFLGFPRLTPFSFFFVHSIFFIYRPSIDQ